MSLGRAESLAAVAERVHACRRCSRLVAWREQVAREKRRSFQDEDYWGRPVSGFGDPAARVLVVGLAPAAHGANRTGRMFTGDRSGDWLYRALDRAGFANQPEATARDDGLELRDVFITATVRCAPPANRPTVQERAACRPYLEREFELLSEARVIVTLGGFAYAAVLRMLRDRGGAVPRPAPKFGHATEVSVHPVVGGVHSADALYWPWPGRGVTVLASYHPSQQNTFTGTLTEPMFDEIWARCSILTGR